MAHVKSLVERGSKVVVVTPDFVMPDRPVPPTLLPITGVEHLTIGTQKVPLYRKVLCMQYSLRSFASFMSLLRRIKPDIVHATQECSLQVLATACLLCDVPLMVSMHTDTAQISRMDGGFEVAPGVFGRFCAYMAGEFFAFWGYRNWAMAGAWFFPVSPQARLMLQNAGVNSKRVLQDNWGPMVDRKVFRIDQPEEKVAAERRRLTFGIEGAYLLVYVGRVTEEKDIQFLVDALSRAPSNVVLALVGAGSMVQRLSVLHGAESRLHCDGCFVSREDVALSLRAADCCVSASVMETTGFTAMESLSCGTPMLAARAQGFAEHLSHGTNARLWTPYDTSSFDQELKAMMATDREGSWTAEALRASMEHASIEYCTDRALDAYKNTGHANLRLFRLALTLYVFVLNWLLSFVIW
jgi:glycosyltransferase involved in cell wall biosynthesis